MGSTGGEGVTARLTSLRRMRKWAHIANPGSRVLAGTLCPILLAACAEKPIFTKATAIDDASTLQASLAFLEDGKTTREEVRNRLGPPSGEFDQGRIWTYSRLAAAHHVVLVFGDQDIVKVRRIVKVR